MTKGIFFDLYGTLLIYGDMEKAWSDWIHHLHISFQDLGLSMSKEKLSVECDQFFAKDLPSKYSHDLTVFENRLNGLALKLGLCISSEVLRFIANLIVGKWQDQISLDPEAVSTIQTLKKYGKIGLVSNFDHSSHVRVILSKYKLEELFDAVVISGEVGVKKPDPEIFVPALIETGLDASNVIYVGDTEEDIIAARSANMKPILIKRENAGTDSSTLDFSAGSQGQSWESNLNELQISSLPELIKLFE